MDPRIAELTRTLTKNPGAGEVTLREATSNLGRALPADYLEFMRSANGAEGSIGGKAYVSLWPLKELELLNAEYAVTEFAPGLILFGSDGGDTAYAFDTRTNEERIVEVPFVGMSVDTITPLGDSLVDFFERLAAQE